MHVVSLPPSFSLPLIPPPSFLSPPFLSPLLLSPPYSSLPLPPLLSLPPSLFFSHFVSFFSQKSSSFKSEASIFKFYIFMCTT